MPTCKECGEDKKHEAHGLCRRCYNKQYNKKYRETHKKEMNETKRKLWYANGGKPASENKKCTVFLGVHVAERVLSKVFKDVKQMPPHHTGYDFICNKGKKIDVKSACTRTHHNWSDSWMFHIKRNKIADYFLCLAFDNREDLNPLYIWLVPGNIINHLATTGIAESTLSKWDKYKLDINKVVACCDTMKNSNYS